MTPVDILFLAVIALFFNGIRIGNQSIRGGPDAN